jgi:hypothetical protein
LELHPIHLSEALNQILLDPLESYPNAVISGGPWPVVRFGIEQ